jgi:hypothetical protein
LALPRGRVNSAVVRLFMNSTRCLIALVFLLSGVAITDARASVPDVFWIDRYGHIAWEDEKARLDNFTIQLTHDANYLGYIYVNAGLVSCKGEAQAHAMRIKNYMTHVRNAPWDRIIWRDTGYAESFEVSLWIGLRGKGPMYVPEYQRATATQVIKDCAGNPFRRRKRVTL